MARTNSRKADRKSSSPASNRLVNEHDAADLLGLSVATMRRWRWAGRPPAFVKVGAAVRYDPAVLADFVEASRRSSTSDPGSDALS
jgi:hypothetical protein